MSTSVSVSRLAHLEFPKGVTKDQQRIGVGNKGKCGSNTLCSSHRSKVKIGVHIRGPCLPVHWRGCLIISKTLNTNRTSRHT